MCCDDVTSWVSSAPGYGKSANFYLPIESLYGETRYIGGNIYYGPHDWAQRLEQDARGWAREFGGTDPFEASDMWVVWVYRAMA
jgi:hypothetical protein